MRFSNFYTPSLILLITGSLLFPGCSASVEKQMTGEWRGKKISVDKTFSEEDRALIESMGEELAASTVYTFTEDNKLLINSNFAGNKTSEEGSYRTTGKDTLIVEFKQDGQIDTSVIKTLTETELVLVEFKGGKSLTFTFEKVK